MGITRTRRISEEIKKVVSNLLLFELKDPRISRMTSVTSVDTTNDLRYTNIYISVYDPNADLDQTIEGLNKAKGFIRKEIGKAIDLRYTPEPIFIKDESIEKGVYLTNLIKKVNEEDDAHAVHADEADDSAEGLEDQEEDEENEDEE
ncbi:30S ribosome-binding factor RbfA [Acidaminobacter hydrogenoformans]|uniref:Ribosome-binding factor A n=1 Tax=Acidaminobacter hydrogenoformans DSM 2784 TaxID=1120920 RepID=A0A1G5RS81_9FIRM|nr:30S ribosome-binding factor RbfA [Acidaminobacter hydrogenoformans]SCZ76846.1 ribosome-binding factor A [Acidaminobacter hydrogenoformans DSM 2784]